MSGEAVLVVSRKDQRDIKFRESLVILDGKEIANLKYGDSLERAIEPGRHTLQTWNRVFKSAVLEWDAKAGERATFSTGNIPNGCFAFLMILQMAPPTIFLKRVDDASD